MVSSLSCYDGGEGGLRNLARVSSTNFVVARNGCNSCYNEWCSVGPNHLSGQPEKSCLLVVYEGGDR